MFQKKFVLYTRAKIWNKDKDRKQLTKKKIKLTDRQTDRHTDTKIHKTDPLV